MALATSYTGWISPRIMKLHIIKCRQGSFSNVLRSLDFSTCIQASLPFGADIEKFTFGKLDCG